MKKNRHGWVGHSPVQVRRALSLPPEVEARLRGIKSAKQRELWRRALEVEQQIDFLLPKL